MRRYLSRVKTICLFNLVAFIVIMNISSCKKAENVNEHLVAFRSNGGTNIAPLWIKDGQILPTKHLYPNPIVSDGGKFSGWFTDSLFNDPYDFSRPVTTDFTLYAKFLYKTYTVAFVMNGATEKVSVEVRDGKLLKLQKPVYDGFIFAGWYKDAAFTSLFDINEPISDNLTLHARWVEPSPAAWFAVDANGVLLGCSPPDGTKTVVIPEGVKVIPDWFVLANGLNEPNKPGFPTGKNISEFILPSSLERIGVGSFQYAAITRIEIPPKVKALEQVSFAGCDRLVSFTFAEGSTLERLIGSDGNGPVIAASTLQTISFPPSLQYVGKYTMAGCNMLRVVTFERSESPVIFDTFMPGGGVWLFGGYFPTRIRMPLQIKDAFIAEMRKVMSDYEYDSMRNVTEGY